MAEYLIQDSTLTEIADAIREKTGSTSSIRTENMASMIRGISSGGLEWINVKELPAIYSVLEEDEIIEEPPLEDNISRYYLEIGSDVIAIVVCGISYDYGFYCKSVARSSSSKTFGEVPFINSSFAGVSNTMVEFYIDDLWIKTCYFALITKPSNI